MFSATMNREQPLQGPPREHYMHTNPTTEAVWDGEKPHSDERDSEIKQNIREAVRLLRGRRDPYIRDYLHHHNGRIPAELYDDGFNGHHRSDRARKIWGQLAVMEDRHHLLVMVTFNGGGKNPAALYNGKAQAWAKKLVRRIYGDIEFFARVEYGPETGIHVHVVIPFMVYAQAPDQGDDVKLVWNTWGMAKYLSKPGDSRAALSNNQRQVVPAELADAIALYFVEQSRNFRQRHEAARAKGKSPPNKTRLPSMRFSSDGLPAAGEVFAEGQCVMLIHPYQWHLHTDLHEETTSDEQVRSTVDDPPRSNPVWTQVMTLRLMPQRRPEPVRGGVRGGATLSRALRDLEAGHQEGGGVPQVRPLLPVSLKAQEDRAERLQRPTPLNLTAPRLPQHRAVEPAGVGVPECSAQGRRQPSNSFRPFGRVDVDQITQPVHDVPHVLDDADTLRVCDFPFINNGVQGISRANGPRF